jgi:oligopeptide/dipeptide ABC transporter ATP-binding protein
MSIVMKLQNLHVRFPGLFKTVHAVRGVSLNLHVGEIVALVGESGSGKTMTAMASLGLLPEHAEVSGEYQWLDDVGNCAELSGQSIREGAVVFQNPLTALNPYFTIGQQLTDVAFARTQLTGPEIKGALLRALHDVSIPNPEATLNKYPHQLSGGQIQRVVIAMALVCEPKVLIADEPTTALDVTVQAQILILLKELAEKRGLAVLLITHDLGVVGTISDRVEVMYAGEIVESGDVTDVLSQPQHPYTQQLLATVPQIDRFDRDLYYIPGQVPDLSKPIQGCAFRARCDKAEQSCTEPVPTLTIETRTVCCHQPWNQIAANGEKV